MTVDIMLFFTKMLYLRCLVIDLWRLCTLISWSYIIYVCKATKSALINISETKFLAAWAEEIFWDCKRIGVYITSKHGFAYDGMPFLSNNYWYTKPQKHPDADTENNTNFYFIFIKTYLPRITHQPKAVLHEVLKINRQRAKCPQYFKKSANATSNDHPINLWSSFYRTGFYLAKGTLFDYFIFYCLYLVT